MTHQPRINDHSNDLPQLTTTEELIVQYLDGELVRNELEAMLFERLAQSMEARTLLREYLLMRGAIRSSMDADIFQLSAELDERTRGRIEHVLQTIALETPAGVIPMREFAPDALPIATNATARRMRNRVLRPALALLILVLSVGTTWYVTRSHVLHSELASNVNPQTANQQVTSHQQLPPSSNAQSSDDRSAVITAPTQELPSAPSIASSRIPTQASSASVREVIRYKYLDRPASSADHAADMTNAIAQNTAATVTPSPTKQADNIQTTSDPAAIMISHRYAKLLNETAKHEVVVTSHDRL